MADIEVNVESTNRQIDINLSSPSDIDTSTKERGPAGSSGSSGTDGSSGTSGTSGSSGIDGNFAGASFEYNFLTNVDFPAPLAILNLAPRSKIKLQE